MDWRGVSFQFCCVEPPLFRAAFRWNFVALCFRVSTARINLRLLLRCRRGLETHFHVDENAVTLGIVCAPPCPLIRTRILTYVVVLVLLVFLLQVFLLLFLLLILLRLLLLLQLLPILLLLLLLLLLRLVVVLLLPLTDTMNIRAIASTTLTMRSTDDTSMAVLVIGEVVLFLILLLFELVATSLPLPTSKQQKYVCGFIFDREAKIHS